MLSPEYLKDIPKDLIYVYEDIEDIVLSDIAEKLKKAKELDANSVYKFKQLFTSESDYEHLRKKLSKMLKESESVVDELIEKGIQKHYKDEQDIYKLVGKTLIDLKDNPIALAKIELYKNALKDNLGKLSKTMGVVVGDDLYPLKDLYKHELNKAIISTQIGVIDQNIAIRKAINRLADNGIKYINYEDSGRNYTLGSAVSMNLRTTLNQLSGEISLINAKDMGQDLMEITAHLGARLTHSAWQGKIVSLSGNDKYLSLDDIGYGEVSGFMGANCKHNWYPFFEGLSYRNYTDDYLKELENKTVTYNDKEISYYEATQIQRKLERDIRRLKTKVDLFNQVGDTQMANIQKLNLKQKQAQYNNFSKQVDIHTKNENLGIKVTKKAENTEKVLVNDVKIGYNNVMKDKVNILIDEFTPCLIEMKTGKIVDTVVSVAKYEDLDLKGWNFDWQKEFKQGKVFKLLLENDDRIQGLVSLYYDKKSNAVYVRLVESAPHNLGINREFNGVGGHLFAEACKQAIDRDFDAIYFDAKTNLIKYYEDNLGAELIGYGNRMILEGEKFLELFERYYGKKIK